METPVEPYADNPQQQTNRKNRHTFDDRVYAVDLGQVLNLLLFQTSLGRVQKDLILFVNAENSPIDEQPNQDYRLSPPTQPSPQTKE